MHLDGFSDSNCRTRSRTGEHSDIPNQTAKSEKCCAWDRDRIKASRQENGQQTLEIRDTKRTRGRRIRGSYFRFLTTDVSPSLAVVRFDLASLTRKDIKKTSVRTLLFPDLIFKDFYTGTKNNRDIILTGIASSAQYFQPMLVASHVYVGNTNNF